jgi:hypothetical protein
VAAESRALQWRKSSWSANDVNCVEVAFAGDDVHTRDSKNPAGHGLVFGQSAWSGFVQGLRDGRFGNPSRS